MKLTSAFLSFLTAASVVSGADRADARPDDSYSPAALADKKALCTIKGQFSPVCLEFYTDIYIKNSPQIDRKVQSDLVTCFEETKQAETNGVSRSSAATATSFVHNQEAGEASVKNKYVDECITMTERLLPGWRAAAMTDVARVKFLERVKELLHKDFAKTCGQSVQVGMGEDGDPFSLVVSRPLTKANKAVFFHETDPDGNAVSVLCNGFIVGKTKAGKAIRIPPVTVAEIDAAKSAASKGCLDECLHTTAPDAACYVPGQRGVITSTCVAHCKAKCRR